MGQTDLEQVWKLMTSISFCMLSNWDGERIHSRPMGAVVRQDEGAIYFFTDDRAHKDDEIRQYHKVGLAFADPRGQKYVSVSGTAAVCRDRKKIEELWTVPAKVWWKTPDNPHLRLIKVTPEQAEYWDAPGNAISNLKVAFALVKGTYPTAGKHEKVTL